MASLDRDPISGTFHIRFRYRGRSFKRSLGTGNAKLARAIECRVEETLILLRNGRVRIPPGADPGVFILPDGEQLTTDESPLLTTEELLSAYQTSRLLGSKEASTLKTENLRIRQLKRILKPRSFAQSLSINQHQQYVGARLSEVRRGGRPVAAETVHKEVATFRVVWVTGRVDFGH
jgi:hypothetical protein